MVNLHERRLPVPAELAGGLLASVAEPRSGLWPEDRWPPMRFDRPLGVGAVGGHGPIRYVVDEWVPGRRVRFRFTAPAGFEGWHEYTVVPAGEGCELRHVLAMRTRRWGRASWPLAYRPLHDALIEDSLTRAADTLGLPTPPARWSLRVRLLRRLLRGRRNG